MIQFLDDLDMALAQQQLTFFAVYRRYEPALPGLVASCRASSKAAPIPHRDGGALTGASPQRGEVEHQQLRPASAVSAMPEPNLKVNLRDTP